MRDVGSWPWNAEGFWPMRKSRPVCFGQVELTTWLSSFEYQYTRKFLYQPRKWLFGQPARKLSVDPWWAHKLFVNLVPGIYLPMPDLSGVDQVKGEKERCYTVKTLDQFHGSTLGRHMEQASHDLLDVCDCLGDDDQGTDHRPGVGHLDLESMKMLSGKW